jgi:hypothetical protein
MNDLVVSTALSKAVKIAWVQILQKQTTRIGPLTSYLPLTQFIDFLHQGFFGFFWLRVTEKGIKNVDFDVICRLSPLEQRDPMLFLELDESRWVRLMEAST